jgi:dienelactone hydrolase
MARRWVLGIAAVLAVLLPIGLGVLLWWGGLPTTSAPVVPKVVDERCREGPAGRVLLHVTLADERLGPVGFTISLPDPLPSGKLPVVVVLGGLGPGENNIRFIDAAGDNAIVGYDWPLPTAFPKGVQAVTGIPSLRRSALVIPGQVSAMLRWLTAQPWSEPERISLLGFSLGAIAAPAAEHVARQEGIDIGWTVLAYGGVGIAALIDGDRYIKPAWARPLLGWAAALLLRPLEPAMHLPHLAGHFLVIGASEDTLIDLPASTALQALTPAPKTIIRIAGDHIGTGPDRGALLLEAVAVTRRWLEAEGAVNAALP